MYTYNYLSPKLRQLVILLLCGFVFLLSPIFSSSAQRQAEQPAITYPPELVKELKQLQQAALTSDYAFRQLAHLTDSTVHD